MSIPVYVRNPGESIPEKGTGYVVSREGLQLRLDSDWLSAVIPVKEFKSLESEPKRAKLLLEPISAVLFAQIVAFYRQIFEQKKTEVAVLLHYNFTTKEWLFTVPTQRVSPSGVEYYDMKERVPGYRCVGTSHSHASFSAGHSQTDIMDEQCFDGVHITVGNLNAYPKVTLSPEIVVRGVRFPLPLEMIGGLSAVESPDSGLLWTYGFDKYFRIDPSIVGDWNVPVEWTEKVALSTRVIGTFGKPKSPIKSLFELGDADFDEITDGFPVYSSEPRRVPALDSKLAPTKDGPDVPKSVPVLKTDEPPVKTDCPVSEPLKIPLYHPLNDLWKSIVFLFFGDPSKKTPKETLEQSAVKQPPKATSITIVPPDKTDKKE